MRVTAGPRSILRDVVVEGGDATRPTIARSITLATDAPLISWRFAETRRRLYDLNVYRSVDIQVQPVAPDRSPPSTTTPAEQPVMARIVLEERPRYRVRYGLRSATKRSERTSGIDASASRPTWRTATSSVARQPRACRCGCVATSRWAASRLVRSASSGCRSAPPCSSSASANSSTRRGHFRATSDVNNFTAGKQTYRLRRAIELRYGYGIERNHTFIRTDTPDPFDLTVKVARADGQRPCRSAG